MNKISLFLVSLFSFFSVQSQDIPYKVRPITDGAITLSTGIIGLIGYEYILRGKEPLDSSFVVTLSPEDVNKFDRGATQYFNNVVPFDDIALYTTLLLPASLIADRSIRSQAGKIGLLYLETMGVMGIAYTWGVGFTNRIRPYVYNPNVQLEKKLEEGTKNSFYAGHPAAAATASFFLAKVYHDFHPDSKLTRFLWAGAVVPPATVAYLRYRNGQHFFSDILFGIPLGAFIGIIIPHLHKKKELKNLSIQPLPSGARVSLKF